VVETVLLTINGQTLEAPPGSVFVPASALHVDRETGGRQATLEDLLQPLAIVGMDQGTRLEAQHLGGRETEQPRCGLAGVAHDAFSVDQKHAVGAVLHERADALLAAGHSRLGPAPQARGPRREQSSGEHAGAANEVVARAEDAVGNADHDRQSESEGSDAQDPAGSGADRFQERARREHADEHGLNAAAEIDRRDQSRDREAQGGPAIPAAVRGDSCHLSRHVTAHWFGKVARL